MLGCIKKYVKNDEYLFMNRFGRSVFMLKLLSRDRKGLVIVFYEIKFFLQFFILMYSTFFLSCPILFISLTILLEQ